jgi:hypothetical protein
MTLPKIRDEFFIVENFIDEQTCKSIINYFDFLVDNKILKWNEISFYGSQAMGYWPSDVNLLKFGLPEDYFNQLKEKIKSKTEELLGFEVNEVSYHAQRWIEGAFADYHSDNSDEHGNPTAFEKSKYAVFIYLNNDFEGGHLKFKDGSIEIKPEIGLGAFFAGGHQREHMVTTVKGGIRYTIGSFWDDARCEYTEEQKQAWADELKQVRAEQEELYKKWATPEGKPVMPKGRE